MKNYLGRIIILVEDYDEALNFYAKNFGFTPLFDVSTDVGQRFLHVGTDPKDSLGIWFLKSDGKGKSHIGNQTHGQPTMVIYTTSLGQIHQQLVSNGVQIKIAPVYTPEYKFLHCLDLYGNEIVVVELDH